MVNLDESNLAQDMPRKGYWKKERVVRGLRIGLLEAGECHGCLLSTVLLTVVLLG